MRRVRLIHQSNQCPRIKNQWSASRVRNRVLFLSSRVFTRSQDSRVSTLRRRVDSEWLMRADFSDFYWKSAELCLACLNFRMAWEGWKWLRQSRIEQSPACAWLLRRLLAPWPCEGGRLPCLCIPSKLRLPAWWSKAGVTAGKPSRSWNTIESSLIWMKAEPSAFGPPKLFSSSPPSPSSKGQWRDEEEETFCGVGVAENQDWLELMISQSSWLTRERSCWSGDLSSKTREESSLKFALTAMIFSNSSPSSDFRSSKFRSQTRLVGWEESRDRVLCDLLPSRSEPRKNAIPS